MRHRGIIIEKNSKEVLVQVEDPAKTCGSCNGCMRLMPHKTSAEYYVVRTKDPEGKYEVGDEVILDGEMRPYVRALAVLYGLPFTALFAGYGVGRLVWESDTIGGMGGIVGLVLGAFVARIVTRRLLKQEPEYRIVARACS
ncbi:MAG: SoxR reducing system RseC family protein [Limnochordia bacterium]